MEAYFRVTQKQSGGGGGATITVSYSSAYYSKTITCSDGTTTYTATTTSSGSTTFNVNATGTWTITCNGKTTSVDVVLEYETTMVPEGSTVLPTDDIQTWLECAGITDKSYTTLAEVLADSTTLLALMSSNNAVDYLVRSKTWIKATALVPTLAADDGNTFSSPSYNATTYPAWKAFDGDLSTSYISQATQPAYAYVGYTFSSAKSVSRVDAYLRQDLPSEFIVQGSNDGFVSDVHDLTNTIAVAAGAGMVSASVDDSAQYTSYRIYGRCTQTSSNYSFQVFELQFYTSAGVTDDATAMTDIGANDYAAATLLADADWRDGIGYSEYFENVLDEKIPTMTSNTTPSGVASASSTYSGYDPYKAFDGNNATAWATSASARPGDWIRYQFADDGIVANRVYVNLSSYGTSTIVKLQGSNDGSNWTDLTDINVNASSFEKVDVFANTTKYKYYRLYTYSGSASYSANVSTLQVNGR